MTQEITHDEMVEKTITAIVNEQIAKYGHFVCNILEGESLGGEESIYIEICYFESAIPVPPEVTIKLRTTLRDALWEIGETRFPYLSYLIGQSN